MVKRTRVELKVVADDNVAVSIPLVDRGRGDPRNILGIIVNRDLDTDHHTIGVKAAVLHGRYSRNQFDLCPQRLLTLDDVNEENQVSLRTAVHAQSACGGQGFLKCNCSGASLHHHHHHHHRHKSYSAQSYDVSHCRILPPDKTEWWLISATLCG